MRQLNPIEENKMRTPVYDSNHPVAIAVMPMRADAITRAERRAKDHVEFITTALRDRGFNRHAYAPNPAHTNLEPGTFAYKVAYESYVLVCQLTEVVKAQSEGECLVRMSETGINRYVEKEKDRAARVYDAFICKLTQKIGSCESAEITGNHVWGDSYVTVKKGYATQVWHTKTIDNRSKYNRWFHQYPTRLKKDYSLIC